MGFFWAVLKWWREQLTEYAKVVKISDSVEESFNDGMAILCLLHKLDATSVDIREAARRRRDEGIDGRRANLELAFALAKDHLVGRRVIALSAHLAQRFLSCWLHTHTRTR